MTFKVLQGMMIGQSLNISDTCYHHCYACAREPSDPTAIQRVQRQATKSNQKWIALLNRNGDPQKFTTIE